MVWLIVLFTALLMDLFFGDPQGLPHPIRWIGSLIIWCEKRIRPIFSNTAKGELMAGFLFAIIVIIVPATVTGGILFLAKLCNWWLYIILEVILCYYLFAMKSLKTESMRVYHALKLKDLKKSREAVSRIVGRDTGNLTEQGVMRAAVETVAENCADGLVAPAFFVVIGGPLAGLIYKTVNTMDSMVGYRNHKYLYFGRFAAKLDDVLNFIPARLAGQCMVLTAFLLGYDGKNAWRIYYRDRHNHKSPNSAHTEAACAGALGLRLAGPSWYFGEKQDKPYIGDEIREISVEDIKRANRLHYGTSLFCVLLLAIFKLCMIHILFH